MAREFAYKFYKSKAWKDCRSAFITERIKIDGGLCQKCHKGPGYIVHHKVHLSPSNIMDPTISLSFSNLEYWCLPCHSAEHNGGHEALRCGFDENGRPINVST